MARRTHHKRTDDEWVAALRGDLGPREQESAYEDLANYLYVIAYNYLRLHKDSVPGLHCKSNDQLVALAEDFTQDTLTRVALEQLYNRYRGEGRFLAYMAVVALNEVRQELRLIKWQICEEPLPPPEPEYDAESGDNLPPFEYVVSTDLGPQIRQELQALWHTIRQCIQQLPKQQRRAFVLNILEGLSAAEVKHRLNAPSEQAVYNLVNRARSRLKACLVEASWNPDDIWPLFS